MKVSKVNKFPYRRNTWVAIASMTLLSACATVSSESVKPIKIDGSSTVYPITQAILEAYNNQSAKKVIPEIKIEGNFSGTGGGFQKFCAGETDISAASRPITQAEMSACSQNSISFIELPIAFDAITVVVNPQNTWADTLTTAELKTIWQEPSQGKVTQWQQVNSTFPQRPLTLYGPGKDSGTYDYFTEAIMGQDGASRQDFVSSEDDNVLVTGVAQDPNSLGYFGFAYYEQNQDKLKAVAIDNGNGGVLPSREAVEQGQYQPLARPLLIYVNAQKAQENPALEEFVEFYLAQAPKTVAAIGYIPLPAEGYHLAQVHFQRFKVGTVFDGKPQMDITIGELLRKQAKLE